MGSTTQHQQPCWRSKAAYASVAAHRRLTGSADKVANFTFLAASSSYFRARRPISVVHTGCNRHRQYSRRRQALAARRVRPVEKGILRQSGYGTHREVCRMREQDCPRALDPFMPVHWPLSCVGVKVRDNSAETQNLIIVSATILIGMRLCTRLSQLSRKTTLDHTPSDELSG